MAWDTTADTVAEMAETSNETVPRVEEVSPTRTWTLSETEFNVEARGLLARVEVAEAMEVLGAARFLAGISYRIQLIIKYEKQTRTQDVGSLK